MSNLIVPAQSDLALALREPALLTPLRHPGGKVKVDWDRNPYLAGTFPFFAAIAPGVDNPGTWGITALSGGAAVKPYAFVHDGTEGGTFSGTTNDWFGSSYDEPILLAAVWRGETSIFAGDGALEDRYFLLMAVAGTLYGRSRRSISVQGNNYINLTADVSSEWNAAVYFQSQSNRHELWLNGRLVGSNTSSDMTVDLTLTKFGIGGNLDSSPFYTAGETAVALALSAVAGADVHGKFQRFARAFTANPYATLLAPANDAPYILSVPGASGPTIDSITMSAIQQTTATATVAVTV